MKYRIVTAFPEGYRIQQKRFLFWVDSVFNRGEKNSVFLYSDLESARRGVERLKNAGKVVT